MRPNLGERQVSELITHYLTFVALRPEGINSDPAFAVWWGRQLLRLWICRRNRNRRYHTDRPDHVARLGASIDTIASARGRSVSRRRANCMACCPTENLVRSDQALGGVLLNE